MTRLSSTSRAPPSPAADPGIDLLLSAWTRIAFPRSARHYSYTRWRTCAAIARSRVDRHGLERCTPVQPLTGPSGVASSSPSSTKAYAVLTTKSSWRDLTTISLWHPLPPFPGVTKPCLEIGSPGESNRVTQNELSSAGLPPDEPTTNVGAPRSFVRRTVAVDHGSPAFTPPSPISERMSSLENVLGASSEVAATEWLDAVSSAAGAPTIPVAGATSTVTGCAGGAPAQATHAAARINSMVLMAPRRSLDLEFFSTAQPGASATRVREHG